MAHSTSFTSAKDRHLLLHLSPQLPPLHLALARLCPKIAHPCRPPRAPEGASMANLSLNGSHPAVYHGPGSGGDATAAAEGLLQPQRRHLVSSFPYARPTSPPRTNRPSPPHSPLPSPTGPPQPRLLIPYSEPHSRLPNREAPPPSQTRGRPTVAQGLSNDRLGQAGCGVCCPMTGPLCTTGPSYPNLDWLPGPAALDVCKP